MFRWWGVGTWAYSERLIDHECIKCSDGGVSEPNRLFGVGVPRVYQVFRWWGVGTGACPTPAHFMSVSSVPMVGCRNEVIDQPGGISECIKCSDGGVSEPSISSRTAT